MWGDWRDTYSHGTLAIWPPDDVRAVVNPLRERYDPASAAISEAHITMTQPFAREPSEDDLTVLADLIGHQKPLELVYGPLATFLPYPCLYLAVAPAGPLTALHSELQATGLFHPVPSHHKGFVPHMTILEGTHTSDEILNLAEELRESAPTGTFTCRAIAYIVPDAAFHFSVARQFRFGREPRVSN